MRRAVLPLLILAMTASPALAQDPVYTDDPAAEEGVVLPDEDAPDVPGEDAADVPDADPVVPDVPPPGIAPVIPDPAVPAVEQKTSKRAISAAPRRSGPTVPGTTAVLRADGTAVPPRSAPLAVKRMIWTANRMVGLRYLWGGGHRSFADRGYDCSGAVSYALHAGALLDWPLVSGQLATWGRSGPGRWVTIYANRSHVYMAIAGLRLDTSPVADPAGGNGPRWRPRWRPSTRFHIRHPVGL